jgi:hypothetical protein
VKAPPSGGAFAVCGWPWSFRTAANWTSASGNPSKTADFLSFWPSNSPKKGQNQGFAVTDSSTGQKMQAIDFVKVTSNEGV